MLFDENALDISQVIRYFHNIRDKYNGNLSIYYEMENNEDASTRGIVEIDELENGKITSLFEKPADSSITSSRLASVVFYCLTRDTLPRIDDYLEAHTDIKERGFGCFVNWAIQNGTPFYGMKIPTRFQLIGNGQIHFRANFYSTTVTVINISDEKMTQSRPRGTIRLQKMDKIFCCSRCRYSKPGANCPASICPCRTNWKPIGWIPWEDHCSFN